MVGPPTGLSSSNMKLYELETVPLIDQMVTGMVRYIELYYLIKITKFRLKRTFFPHKISHLEWWMVSF